MARPQSRARVAKPQRRSATPRSKPATSRYVYFFGGGKADGSADMKDLLGGKGANLAEMADIGLPVPPGFTITTEVCTYYYANGKQLPAGAEAPRSRDALAQHREGWSAAQVRRPDEPAARLRAARARARRCRA